MIRLSGTAVAIGGSGVLITGVPGSGKSDLALRLIDRGAVLVADDVVEAEASAGVLLLAPPASIAGRIEVRGVGIAALPFLRGVPVVLVVDLDAEPERLPVAAAQSIDGINVPRLPLRAFDASAPIKIELALSAALTALD